MDSCWECGRTTVLEHLSLVSVYTCILWRQVFTSVMYLKIYSAQLLVQVHSVCLCVRVRVRKWVRGSQTFLITCTQAGSYPQCLEGAGSLTEADGELFCKVDSHPLRSQGHI